MKRFDYLVRQNIADPGSINMPNTPSIAIRGNCFFSGGGGWGGVGRGVGWGGWGGVGWGWFYWAPVSEPGFSDVHISRCSILGFLFVARSF